MHITDPVFYLETDSGKYVFLDYRELENFSQESQNPEIEAIPDDPLLEKAAALVRDEPLLFKQAWLILEQLGIQDQIIEVPRLFPLDLADYLRKKGVTLAVKQPFFSQRSKKSASEIQLIKDNLDKVALIYQKIEAIFHEAVILENKIIYAGQPLTSEYLKGLVHHWLFDEGLFDPEKMIIASGRQTSMPHHSGKGILRPNQPIIIDIFPRHLENGYFADMTRTFVKGVPTKEIVRMHQMVLEAQKLAIESIQPGIQAQGIHQKVVDFFHQAGYHVGEKGFMHGTGHGLGLDVHEEPFINASSTDILQPGQVITIEPGLYYPEWGGVRLEDVILVTDTGYENLTNYHKRLIIG